MAWIIVADNRNHDPVKFYRNRVRVFTDLAKESYVWVDEDKLFELLTLPQKKKYLTDSSGTETKYQVKREVIERVKTLAAPGVKVRICTPLAQMRAKPVSDSSDYSFLLDDGSGAPALHSEEPLLTWR